MDEFWELPSEIQRYIRENDIPIQMYSSPVGEGFDGLNPKAGIVTAVIKRDDEVLFIRHSEDGRFWELPSGHIEDGEHPEKAINREIVEETGYKLDYVQPVVAIVWPFKDTVRVQIVFNATLGDKVSDETDGEAEEVRWHSDIPDEVTFGEFGHKIYQYYIDNWDDVQEEDNSYMKHGFAALGVGLSVAALKGIQKYRSDDDD